MISYLRVNSYSGTTSPHFYFFNACSSQNLPGTIFILSAIKVLQQFDGKIVLLLHLGEMIETTTNNSHLRATDLVSRHGG